MSQSRVGCPRVLDRLSEPRLAAELAFHLARIIHEAWLAVHALLPGHSLWAIPSETEALGGGMQTARSRSASDDLPERPGRVETGWPENRRLLEYHVIDLAAFV